jgi:hypothetical protein
MATCPHCETSVDAQFEPLKRVKGGQLSDSEYATFQLVCPACDRILGGAIMTKTESKSLL